MRGLRNQTESSRAQANAPAQELAGSSRRVEAAPGASASPNRCAKRASPHRQTSIERRARTIQGANRAKPATQRPGFDRIRPTFARGASSPQESKRFGKNMPNNAQPPDRSIFSLFFSEKEGCEESLTPSSPSVRFAQTANIPAPPQPPLKRQVGASSSNRQAAVGAGAGAVFLRCCWMP